ncbi:MAG: aldo/keto reductase [Spirochaetia bacterium]|jgi:aryl-alcohol dehydrogenase-like predicted oxidoreductase|nr:aldo/keto reductase [Spirochaetia bacterium]
MKRLMLGKSGIEVTELCFGALPMGPLQKNMDDESAAAVVERALRGGVNFIDTAQVYSTYRPIRMALERIKTDLPAPVIASKCNAEEYSRMEDAVYEALDELGRDYIDIFHLHAARGDSTLYKKRSGALKALCDLQEKGKIRAKGVSCHSSDLVSVSADVKEIDIVFPLINYTGRGIIGTLDGMRSAIAKCSAAGKGIYLMKVLAGGNHAEKYGKAMQYARSLGNYPVALGMISAKEVDYNLAYFNSESPEAIPDPTFKDFDKRFHVVTKVCIGCGKCIETCASDAIEFRQEKAFILAEKCVMCGYCVESCPSMAIRAL